MVQYHPTTLKGNGLLISEAARGEGAYLLNANGERFMEAYAPNMMELASRDVVSRAGQTEINEGRGVDDCVFLDCRHLGRQFILERLHQIYDEGLTFANVDLTEQPIPIRPGMHYQMGGVKTDVDGRCWDVNGEWDGVRGLFAAGEAACVSLHGGNRLGANSLLDTVVFGRRAGHSAAEFAKAIPLRETSASVMAQYEDQVRVFLSNQSGNDTVAGIRLELGQTMNEHLAVFRNQQGMEMALSTVHQLRDRYSRVGVRDRGMTFNTGLIFALEMGFMLDCAEAIVVGGLERKESRGAHFRTDIPERDDENWMKHVMVYRNPDGSPRVEYLPVVVTRWEPQKRVY